jgi:hypothetical protein
MGALCPEQDSVSLCYTFTSWGDSDQTPRFYNVSIKSNVIHRGRQIIIHRHVLGTWTTHIEKEFPTRRITLGYSHTKVQDIEVDGLICVKPN